MAKIFDSVRVQKPMYSTFDLSHDHKLSFKMGKLVPVMCMETVPGDRVNVSSEAMFRMMPMIAPIMHRVDVQFHHFFVPTRILWDSAERFFAGNEDGGPAAPPAPPILDRDQSYLIEPSSLPNYLGLPVGSISGSPDGTEISALPFAAYQRIFHEYYRDENLDTTAKIQLQDGEQTAGVSNSLLVLQDRAWEHDYFTSALPWAQKGNAVAMPIEFTGDVLVQSEAAVQGASSGTFWRNTANGAISPAGDIAVNVGGNNTINTGSGATVAYDPNGDLYVDKDDFHSQTTVEDFRTAITLQKWLETAARVGSRFVEFLRGFWNVRSSDARLDRPEYLGGSTSQVAISEVLQTSSTEDSTPQGTMAGHGISVNAGKDINYFCEEYGFIITILSMKPRTAYYQGIPRMFSRTIDRFSYPYPQFMNLGEQEIINKELYWDDTDVDWSERSFGYIPRYSEYRYMPGRVSGQMATTLEFWHMGRKFISQPALNAAFIKADPTKRIFAVDAEDEDEIVGHIYLKVFAKRPFPKYGTPGGL